MSCKTPWQAPAAPDEWSLGASPAAATTRGSIEYQKYIFLFFLFTPSWPYKYRPCDPFCTAVLCRPPGSNWDFFYYIRNRAQKKENTSAASWLNLWRPLRGVVLVHRCVNHHHHKFQWPPVVKWKRHLKRKKNLRQDFESKLSNAKECVGRRKQVWLFKKHVSNSWNENRRVIPTRYKYGHRDRYITPSWRHGGLLLFCFSLVVCLLLLLYRWLFLLLSRPLLQHKLSAVWLCKWDKGWLIVKRLRRRKTINEDLTAWAKAWLEWMKTLQRHGKSSSSSLWRRIKAAIVVIMQ